MMAIILRGSSGRRHFRPQEREAGAFRVYMSSLLLLFVLVQQQSSLCSAYSLADFLAAYNNPSVHVHEVKGNIVLTASLPRLTRAFKLVGKGHGGSRPSIDGASRYAGIRTDKDITLENLEFKNFKTSGNGAVLATGFGKAVIHRCVFKNNHGTGGLSAGGALWLESTDFKITHSHFSGNKANNGGAVFSSIDGPGSIHDTVFEDNHARGSGGALGSMKVGGFKIVRCRFTKNKAGNYGGAIWFNRDFVTLSNTHFVDNVAGTFGGAFRFYADDVDGALKVCRGNSFARNRAGTATSNNISISIDFDGSAPFSKVRFCENKPAHTLIDPPTGAVSSSCQYC